MNIEVSGTNKNTVIEELNKYVRDSNAKEYEVTDFGQYEKEGKIFYYFRVIGFLEE